MLFGSIWLSVFLVINSGVDTLSKGSSGKASDLGTSTTGSSGSNIGWATSLIGSSGSNWGLTISILDSEFTLTPLDSDSIFETLSFIIESLLILSASYKNKEFYLYIHNKLSIMSYFSN